MAEHEEPAPEPEPAPEEPEPEPEPERRVPTINDMPPNVLEHILLAGGGSGFANYVVHVSACARVCKAWRKLVASDAGLAYGNELFELLQVYETNSTPLSLGDRKYALTRDTLLAEVARGFGQIRPESGFCFDMTERNDVTDGLMKSVAFSAAIGLDAAATELQTRPRAELTGIQLDRVRALERQATRRDGARLRAPIIGAALRAFPSKEGRVDGALPFTIVRFGLTTNGIDTGFTGPTLAPLLEIMAERGVDHLKRIDVSNNKIGDQGIVALSKVLPAGVRRVLFGGTDCGDDGLCAMAEALPRTSVVTLDCSENPAVTEAGYEALLGALPELKLEKLKVVSIGSPDAEGRWPITDRTAWKSYKRLLRESDRLAGVPPSSRWWWEDDD